MASSKPTQNMRRAMEHAKAHHSQKLYRHHGGYWNNDPGSQYPHGTHFSTRTVDALVNRGLATYTEHGRNSAGLLFPVEATLCQS